MERLQAPNKLLNRQRCEHATVTPRQLHALYRLKLAHGQHSAKVAVTANSENIFVVAIRQVS